MRQRTHFASAFLLISFLPLIRGLSFQINNTPRQCQNVTFQITGSGTPPYSLLLIPYGSTPLSNNVEVRSIQSLLFDQSSGSLSLQLIYPSNSQFVAVVSDNTGFGTGGTSVATTVQSSSDSSCFNASSSTMPAFYYSIDPTNQLVQCSSSRLWWDATNHTIQGTPTFQGIIPGGVSFAIPEGTITNVSEKGTGFSWTPSIRGGTTVMIVGGDDRGKGVAGSSFYIVSSGIDNISSCLNSSSPSSTAGTPAGSLIAGSGSSSNSTPGIVGGVVGGVAAITALALAFIFYMRRRKRQQVDKERPALFLDHEDEGPTEPRRGDRYYEPDPYTLPEPTEGGAEESVSDNRQSLLTYLTDVPGRSATPRSGTPDGGTFLSATSRKSSAPPSLRPVHFILHEDAGPSQVPEGDSEEPETVELPPAYTNIRA